MDTDDLSDMAYRCVVMASDAHHFLKSELGAESKNHKTENSYLHSVLFHVESIKFNTADYLESWSIADTVDIDQFKIKIDVLYEQIKTTISTPMSERGWSE